MAEANTGTASLLTELAGIVPRLRENGAEAESRRWIPDENIALLEKAGVFRAAVPARFGGLDLPLADQARIVAEISRGCGSTGWVVAAWLEGAWVATLYSDRVQEEVFAGGQIRVSGGLAPTGLAVPTDGGFVLNGSWGFNTGCRGADWNFVAAVQELPDGEHDVLYALVPMSELTIADDWDVSAASGTGSFTTSATDVFVPAERALSVAQLLTGGLEGRTNSGATGRNYGLITFVSALSVATYLGIARGALETFLERLPGKAIAYTNWTEQSQHPLTQIKVALAANRITAAQALTDGYLALLQQRADAGELPAPTESATVRGQCGFAIQLVKEAVEELHEVSGASALSRQAHFQRFYRDLEGLSRHGMMTPYTNLELHGRVLLGLDPDTLFL
ncbi:acyl-CoA dehydrogenase family protein [Kitasatospora sp. NPDC002040]|uniref:acyl-CoA dehydrogenase family protein n=1 Tax=Kitasatospora sp. NPDC002040 TaxID=3154661 RepID=UPI003322577F